MIFTCNIITHGSTGEFWCTTHCQAEILCIKQEYTRLRKWLEIIASISCDREYYLEGDSPIGAAKRSAQQALDGKEPPAGYGYESEIQI